MEVSRFALDQLDEWDAMVQDTDSYSFFHSRAWARVLHHAYGFSPCYLACRECGEVALLPVMEIRNPVLGRKGVCLPFSDTCGPIWTGSHARDALASFLPSLVRRERWRMLEIRDDAAPADVSPCGQYCEHVLSLRGGPNKVAGSLRSSTWRNIQRAEREGVEIGVCTSRAALDEYYKLHCITRKRLGVPPQPKRFFDSIYRYAIRQGNGHVVRARYRERTIAAAVFLHFGKRAVYKYGASLPDRGHLRPNNLIMWEAIKWYAIRDFELLSLGRTDPRDAGLMQFKNGWGATCREVHYWRLPPRKARPLNPHRKAHSFVLSIATRLPIAVLKAAGTVAYKYFA